MKAADRRSTVIYRFAANSVLTLHFVFVLLAVFGALGVLLDLRWALVHVPIVIWSSLVNLASWTCPLTPLENRLRTAANESSYQGGFIEHYIGPLIYPQGMPRRLQLVAGVTIVLWNMVLYVIIFWWLTRAAA